MLVADLPGRRAATVGVTVLPAQRGRFARPSTCSAYRYTPSGSSPAQIVPPCISPFRYDPDRGRAWHLGSSARCFGASASLPRQAPPLPSSSRRHAPQCIVGGYASSPCDVSHRASDEPRRCQSLSSALDPSSLASPPIRRVFLRTPCARRRPVGSLNPVRGGVCPPWASIVPACVLARGEENSYFSLLLLLLYLLNLYCFCRATCAAV